MITGTVAQDFEEACGLYEGICLCCGIAAAAFLLLALILFFALHIPQAFETFAGRAVREDTAAAGATQKTTPAVGAEIYALVPEKEEGSVEEQMEETALL